MTPSASGKDAPALPSGFTWDHFPLSEATKNFTSRREHARIFWLCGRLYLEIHLEPNEANTLRDSLLGGKAQSLKGRCGSDSVMQYAYRADNAFHYKSLTEGWIVQGSPEDWFIINFRDLGPKEALDLLKKLWNQIWNEDPGTVSFLSPMYVS